MIFSRMKRTHSYHQTNKKVQVKRQLDFWLIGILLLALFLNAWAIWDAGNANAFYTAAIKSGTLSWKAFFFGSLDPQNYTTVDKPPVALWFPELLARVFGVHGWTVVLPSSLFGVAATYLMYRLIKPKFGSWAGRIAAFIITITPIVVADNRTNNMDATLIFFCLLGIYFLQKAVYKHQLRYVFISFAIIGIAYNVKMLEAFMILPGMVLYYFIALKVPWKKLLFGMVGSVALLGVFSFSYSLIVDSIPASQRPYVGSTEDNSMLSLAFGYNGAQRLLGQSSGSGGAFPGLGNNKNSKILKPSITNQETSTTVQQNGAPEIPKGNKKMGGQGGAGGAFNIGSAGPLRLFQSELGPMASWFLPAAIFGIFIGFFGTRKKKQSWFKFNEQQKETLLWTGWLVPVAGFFSVASFFHPYYLDVLAPPIAALTAIALVVLTKKTKESRMSLANVLAALLVLSTILLQASYAYSYYPKLVIVLIAIASIIAIFWFLPFGKSWLKASLTLGVLSVLTAWWALTPTLAHESAAIPTVGPSLLSQKGGGGIGDLNSDMNSKVLAYTTKNQGSAKYLFATTDASTAAPYIISSGKSVMALGGFNGTDPSITLKEFKQLVKEGKVKYFLTGGKSGGSSTGSTGQVSEIVKWVEANAKKVSSVSSSSSTTQTKTTINGEQRLNNTVTSASQAQVSGQNGQDVGGNQTGQLPPDATDKLSTSEQESLKKLMEKEQSGSISSSDKKKLETLMKKVGMGKAPSTNQSLQSGKGQGGQVQSTPGGSSTLYDLTSIKM